MNVPVRQTNTLAIISLVSGILGCTLFPFLGSIAAVIFGHMARKQIRQAPGQWDGDGFALTGLILGWVALVLWVLGIVLFVLFFGGLAWLGFQNI